ncbi:MAG: hypothetical protein QOD30_2406, partial [Actinomycetota bacterium]|nr:hypothetical protein [Actinomycetota bacterium]
MTISSTRHRVTRIRTLVAASLVAGVAWVVVPAQPSSATVNKLTDSNFEIDTDANTTVDGGGTNVDWNTVTEASVDESGSSGAGDNSFGQGSKEDTAVPSVVSGGIPPNKSDLKTFGVYIENDRFLHMYWTRVQDPSGTTNMDFEFNQSETISANNVTPERTPGDFLITYDLSQGGTHPTISVRILGSNGRWGTATPVADQTAALASINTAGILSANAGGLGNLGPRTFGEASIDMDAVFTECISVGAVFLKSRSSDSFGSALKDFIAPNTGIDFSNCPAATVSTEKHVFLSDEATISGGDHAGEGTVTFNLYRVALGTALPCADFENQTELESFGPDDIDADGHGEIPAADIYEAATSGIYNWVASYTGGGELTAGASSCGEE